MKTEVLKINQFNIDPDQIKKAADMIKSGGLVAFPTETVYGLGADALNPVPCAANLFSVLRDFDKDQVDVIIAEAVEEEGLGIAIMDRLRRASGVSEKDVQ